MTLTCPTVDIAGKYALLADLDGNNSLNLYDIKGNNLRTYPISVSYTHLPIAKFDNL